MDAFENMVVCEEVQKEPIKIIDGRPFVKFKTQDPKTGVFRIHYSEVLKSEIKEIKEDG